MREAGVLLGGNVFSAVGLYFSPYINGNGFDVVPLSSQL